MKLQHVILNLFTLLAIAGSVLQSSPSEARERLKISFEPEAETIPANTLRMYFMFDRPARGLVHQSEVKLVGPDGSEIKNAFMDFGQELWSPDGKRLTVFFDPGKIKRDVEAEGDAVSPLKEGKSYQIKLADYAHSFQVSPPVRERLNPKIWKVIEPSSSSSQLEIKFDRVMDAALLLDQIEVVETKSGARVSTTKKILTGGTGLIFLPRFKWRIGQYAVVASSILEDVSGNRMGESLDHTLGENADEKFREVQRFVIATGITKKQFSNGMKK
jgi:hypothetical protein